MASGAQGLRAVGGLRLPPWHGLKVGQTWLLSPGPQADLQVLSWPPSPRAPQTDLRAPPDTDLDAVICKGGLLKDVHKRYIFHQLLRATEFIHSGHVIHRDQKVSPRSVHWALTPARTHRGDLQPRPRQRSPPSSPPAIQRSPGLQLLGEAM